MPKYHITYAHMDDLQDNPEIQAGWGEITIDQDNYLETDQDLKDLARYIGKLKGFTRVGIVKLDEILEDESETEDE